MKTAALHLMHSERHSEKESVSERKSLRAGLYRQLLTLAGPLVIGNILQQFYNAADAWIIGRFAGSKQFAAVGIAGTAMNLFLFFLVGCCTGISVIFAQLFGAGRQEDFRKEHFQTILIGTAFSAVLSAAGILAMPALLRLTGTPQSLKPFVRAYLGIVLAGLPFSFLYNFYNALLRSVGNVKMPLLILACAITFNVAGDLFLVRVMGLGVRGAAVATVLSQLLSVIISIVYVRKCRPELFFTKNEMHFSRSLLARTISISLVTGIHQAGLYLGKIFVQGAVNSAGTDMISAYTATTRIEGFINSFGDSGAAATSVVTAQSFGAGDRQRVHDTFHCSGVLLAVFGAACSLLLFATASPAAAFMLSSGSGPAYEQAVLYLRLVSVFYIFCFLGNTYAGYFDGIGRSVYPFVGAASHITLRIILSWLWISGMGLSGVALATGLGWIFANVLWGILYLRLNRQPSGKPAGRISQVSCPGKPCQN